MNVRRNIFLVLTLTFFASSLCGQVTKKKNKDIEYKIVVAHRGAWKKNALPENSIASLKQSIALKCAGSEFDVNMTLDDSLIINHDATYNKLPIATTNYADLIAFKLTNGEKLPTLREYILAGMHKNKHTKFICELKVSRTTKERAASVAEKVIKLVHDLKAEKMIVYISFDYDILKKIVELNPKASVQYLSGTKSPEQVKADGMNGVDYQLSVFKQNPDWIESARKNNIALNAWTVDDAEGMDWLLSQGFDFITTNEPELLFERMKTK